MGLWCGVTFGIGLAVGGMVRPSAVTGAFKLEAWDPTLWLLFTTALLVTLAWYRVDPQWLSTSVRCCLASWRVLSLSRYQRLCFRSAFTRHSAAPALQWIT